MAFTKNNQEGCTVMADGEKMGLLRWTGAPVSVAAEEPVVRYGITAYADAPCMHGNTQRNDGTVHDDCDDANEESCQSGKVIVFSVGICAEREIHDIGGIEELM